MGSMPPICPVSSIIVVTKPMVVDIPVTIELGRVRVAATTMIRSLMMMMRTVVHRRWRRREEEEEDDDKTFVSCYYDDDCSFYDCYGHG